MTDHNINVQSVDVSNEQSINENDTEEESSVTIIESPPSAAPSDTALSKNSNPMFLSDEIFEERIGMNKIAYCYILEEYETFRKLPKRFGACLTRRLFAALRFFTDGSIQEKSAFSQPTMSLALSDVLSFMEEVICPKWIQMPETNDTKESSKRNFYEKFGIPGVIGCVGGDSVKISKTPSLLFKNKKGESTLSAMIVWDCNSKIIAVDARYPGSAKQSHIWIQSDLRKYLQRCYNSGGDESWLLGDLSYPLEPWLIVPFDSTEKNNANLFNDRLNLIRKLVIERGKKLLKDRFFCLRTILHYHAVKVSRIFNTCCALHNICLFYNIKEPKSTQNENQDNDESYPIETISKDKNLNSCENIANHLTGLCRRDEIRSKLENVSE